MQMYKGVCPLALFEGATLSCVDASKVDGLCRKARRPQPKMKSGAPDWFSGPRR